MSTSITNILFMTWYTGLGGGETDLLTLAHGLDPARYRPHLVVPREGQLSEHWRRAGWPVHLERFRGASVYFVPALWARFPVVNRLADLLQRENIGLVHSDYHALPLIQPAAARQNIPLLWSLAGWWLRPKPWQRAFFRPLLTIARSHAIRDGFLGEPPFTPPASVPMIYHGIDTNRFSESVDGGPVRAELGLTADVPLVAMVARFQWVKGQHHFLAMAGRVLDQVPEAHFIMAGENVFGGGREAAYKRRVLQQVEADARLRERVHLLGFREDAERIMAAADVVVCPSEFESFGKVNVEAMACGRPVVSTDRGGPSETMRDGETGYLIPPGDPAALADRVTRLLRDPELRARMGRAGRARVLEHFSDRAMVAAYTALFEKLLRA